MGQRSSASSPSWHPEQNLRIEDKRSDGVILLTCNERSFHLSYNFGSTSSCGVNMEPDVCMILRTALLEICILRDVISHRKSLYIHNNGYPSTCSFLEAEPDLSVKAG
ncbi:unnamed protein product [Natator depressus]